MRGHARITTAYASDTSTGWSRWIRQYIASFLMGLFVGVLLLLTYQNNFRSSSMAVGLTGASGALKVPMEPFPEAAWRPPSLISATTVTSTPFARFEVHKVRTESGEVVDDWLWTDERAHVNILVHVKATGKYMLFHQMKYGLDAPKHAAVGGLFNVGETPLECANRELLEETGMVAGEMVYLGGYRVQVNRGGGILHAFLARDSEPAKTGKSSTATAAAATPTTSLVSGSADGSGTDAASSNLRAPALTVLQPDSLDRDYEAQAVKMLSREELLRVVLKEQTVGEAQWLAAIATGLLHMEHFDEL